MMPAETPAKMLVEPLRPALRPALARLRFAAMAAGAVSLVAGSVIEPVAAHADTPNQTIIRDTEIEQLMRDYTAPVMRAAGVKTGAVKVVLIGDRSFNAFVADGRHIFINVGAIIESKSPNEVVGVLAHETGHIAGGHLARLRQQLANAQIMAVAGMLLGAGAVAGAASSGNRVGNAGAGAMGVMAGTQELVKRNMLSYQRAEEQAADRAAVRFLENTGQSPAGLLATFKRFSDESLFRTSQVDPYLQSHPMPQERIASLQTLVDASPTREAKDPPALVARHALARAKLVGFVERPESVTRKYPPNDSSAAARYARAVAAFRSARLNDALGQIDGLIKEEPGNPYFLELKGQILLESGRVRESLVPLRKAVQLAPDAGLIRGMLGHALTVLEDRKLDEEAMREVLNAAQREPDAAEPYQDLARLYARKGNIGMAEMHSAQAYFNMGKWSEAASQASRAMEKLPVGSPGWLKAEDILNYRPPKPKS